MTTVIYITLGSLMAYEIFPKLWRMLVIHHARTTNEKTANEMRNNE